MKASFTLLAAIAGGAMSLAQPAHAQGSSHYYLCSTRDPGRKIGYVSNIFADKAGDLSAVEAAWKQMLTSKYASAPHPSSACQEASSSAAAEAAREKLYKFMSDEGEKVTSTSWSYKAAAVPSKPVVSASSPFAADAENAKGWCEYNMGDLRPLFTCDCFAKMVLHHREKYPNEIQTEKGSTRLAPFQALMVGTPSRLDCAECITDEHVAAFVTHMMEQSKIVQERAGIFKQAAYDAQAACVRKGFKQRILAEPYVDRVTAFYNLTAAACAGSRP